MIIIETVCLLIAVIYTMLGTLLLMTVVKSNRLSVLLPISFVVLIAVFGMFASFWAAPLLILSLFGTAALVGSKRASK